MNNLRMPILAGAVALAFVGVAPDSASALWLGSKEPGSRQGSRARRSKESRRSSSKSKKGSRFGNFSKEKLRARLRKSSRSGRTSRGRSSSKSRWSSSKGRYGSRGRSSSKGRWSSRGRSSSKGRYSSRGRSSSKGRYSSRGRSSGKGRFSGLGLSWKKSLRGNASGKSRWSSRGRSSKGRHESRGAKSGRDRSGAGIGKSLAGRWGSLGRGGSGSDGASASSDRDTDGAEQSSSTTEDTESVSSSSSSSSSASAGKWFSCDSSAECGGSKGCVQHGKSSHQKKTNGCQPGVPPSGQSIPGFINTDAICSFPCVCQYSKRRKSGIAKVVLHEGYGTQPKQLLKSTKRWAKKCVSTHFSIRQSGEIHYLLDVNVVANHAKGVNGEAIGIDLELKKKTIDGKKRVYYSDAMVRSLNKLLGWIRNNTSAKTVMAHRCVPGTSHSDPRDFPWDRLEWNGTVMRRDDCK